MQKVKIKMPGKGKSKTPTQAYKDFMRAKRGRKLSPDTIRYYFKKVGRFTGWLGKEVTYIDEITDEDIYSYIEYLTEEFEVCDESINTHLRAIKAFVNYFRLKVKIKLLKVQETIKETYTEEELKILLKKPPLKSFAEYRNWVIVNWLLATGNRLGTIVEVKIKDLDFENELLYLNKTKNKKVLVIPMSATLAEVLNEYLEYRNGSPDDYLFCTQYGQKFKKDGLRNAIRSYHNKRGINRHSIHLYRHTFAKLSILNGIDPLRLQKILGHKTLEMTQRYVNLYGTDLKKGFNTYNPLEQFKKPKHIKLNK